METVCSRQIRKCNKVLLANKCFLLMYSLMISIVVLNSTLYSTRKIVCAWMLFMAAYLILTDFNHYLKGCYIVMGLFCLSYTITFVTNGRNNILNELLMLGYTASSFFLLTYVPEDQKEKDIIQDLRIMGYCFLIVSAILSLSNCVIYVLSFENPDGFREKTGLWGIHNAQLGGLYNPNTGGVINYISLIISAFFFRKANKKIKSLLIANIIIQYLCFALVQSRGAWICFLLFVCCYFLLGTGSWTRKNIGNFFLRIIAAVCCMVLLTSGSFLIRKGIVYAAVKVQLQNSEIADQNGEAQITTPHKSEQEIYNEVNRKGTENSTIEFTTGRKGIWRTGLRTFMKHPVIGIGYRNIDNVLEAGLSEYDYRNSSAGGLHNGYLTVLVSSGIVGFSLYALLISIILWKILNIFRFRKENKTAVMLACLVPSFLVGDLVESRILLTFNNVSVFFWILIGYVMYFGRKEESKC